MARRADLTIISERSQEAGSICRFTVSSDVSPVGPDLVGTSVAVGERVSPQRSPFEGAVRASRIASSVFVVAWGHGYGSRHRRYGGTCGVPGSTHR